MIDAVLVKWGDEPVWHLTPSVRHAKTACKKEIPLLKEPTNHQYIDLLQINNFKGICKKCFHEICIDNQIDPLWDIYYKDIVEEK